MDDKCGRGRPRLGMVSDLIGDRSHVIMKRAANDKIKKDGERTLGDSGVWTCPWQNT